MGIDDGETRHSFRVGISYTLKGLGCTPDQIAQYVGWRSTEMALYYTRHFSASVSLDLLERVTRNLASAGPDLMKGICKRFVIKLYLFLS